MSEPRYPFWHYKRHPEAFGIFLSVFVLSQFISLLTFHAGFPEKNALGLFGYVTAHIWFFLCGINACIALFGLLFLSYKLIFHDEISFSKKHLYAATISVCSLNFLTTLVGLLFPSLEKLYQAYLHIPKAFSWQFVLGGVPATYIYKHIPYINFETLFSIIGTALGAFLLLSASICILFDIPIKISWKKAKPPKTAKPEKKEARFSLPLFQDKETAPKRELNFGIALEESSPKKTKPLEWAHASKVGIPVSLEKQLDLSSYALPSIDLLNIPKKVDISELKKELKTKADLLESTLGNFGIEAKVGQIHCGPTVTMYEVHPPTGVKVGKIKTLEHDIALNMEAQSVRIIAPIPGKAAVGIEIPNQTPQEVCFREILHAYQQKGSGFKIPMLLGKAVNGELVLADLTKMPHCIIAGATGSGKSVCINSIIMSIIMLARPDEVKFLMIDPKKVELAPYTELPHMVAPVITEPHTATSALNWLVKEMEKRYEILRITGHRNIDSFNKRDPKVPLPENTLITIPEKLPYMVGIIDELADLMMVASQDVEAPIARIAQMARAVGIHLILATQRPSREVITGLIKANFPARIAFKVASRINSQIILDDIGAETLLGNGDMLILLPGTSQALRAQGVFVRDEEITKVIQTISSKLPPNYLIGSPSSFESFQQNIASEESLDDLFAEAKNTVLQTGNASTTFLQRKLKIGYARAASIMDQLEERGVIGPQEGAKPRKIFYPKGSPTQEE